MTKYKCTKCDFEKEFADGEHILACEKCGSPMALVEEAAETAEATEAQEETQEEAAQTEEEQAESSTEETQQA